MTLHIHRRRHRAFVTLVSGSRTIRLTCATADLADMMGGEE
jgi:hypothetical protein